VSRWASRKDLIAALGLEGSADDTRELRAELLSRLRQLNKDEPGNLHEDVPMLTEALEALDELPPAKPGSLEVARTSNLAIPAAPQPPAVPPTPHAQPQRERSANSERRSLRPVQRAFIGKSIGLGSIAAAMLWLLSAPDKLADHPVVGHLAPWTSKGDVRFVPAAVWASALVALGAVWLFLWRNERRDARLINALHDPDNQLDAARTYFAMDADSDGVIFDPAQYRLYLIRAVWRLPSAWKDKDVERFFAKLPLDLRNAVKNAVDEALARWVQVGWLRLSDAPFSSWYEVVGEITI
jgi:hypothetical protein